MFFLNFTSDRVLFEDSLKFIFDKESRELPATAESVRLFLKISPRKAQALLKKMIARELVTSDGDKIHLSPQGKAAALHIIRAHRLWESYLSEKLGVPLDQLHQQAEIKEHQISPQQADQLDAQLGFPVKDPHGDPIPSFSRKIDLTPIIPLTDWPIGQPARISQLEDEPTEILTQILSEGLLPGTYLKIIEKNEKGFHVSTHLMDSWLSPIVAANIFLEEAPAWVEERDIENLANLKPGEKGKVLAIKTHGLNKQRFLDLGILPGTTITATMMSAFKEPLAYTVRDSLIVLRKEQAEQIIIKRIRP